MTQDPRADERVVGARKTVPGRLAAVERRAADLEQQLAVQRLRWELWRALGWLVAAAGLLVLLWMLARSA